MSVITVDDGALVAQHPLAVKTYEFDWDASNLAVGATIASSTFAVAVRSGANTVPAVVDPTSGGILSGSRKAQVTFSGGTEGTLYRVTHTIIDTESPAQTKVKYLDVLVQA